MISYLMMKPYCIIVHLSHDKDIHSLKKIILDVSFSFKKGSLFSTPKVSVFPEIGVFLGQKSAKRGVLFKPGEH